MVGRLEGHPGVGVEHGHPVEPEPGGDQLDEPLADAGDADPDGRGFPLYRGHRLRAESDPVSGAHWCTILKSVAVRLLMHRGAAGSPLPAQRRCQAGQLADVLIPSLRIDGLDNDVGYQPTSKSVAYVVDVA